MLHFAEEQVELRDEVFEDCANNLQLEFARQILENFKFFNYHVEVVKERIPKSFANCVYKLRLHAFS